MVSSNNVTITEQGHLIVGNIGVSAVAVPALRAHFAAEFEAENEQLANSGLANGVLVAERMPEDVQKLVDEAHGWCPAWGVREW